MAQPASDGDEIRLSEKGSRGRYSIETAAGEAELTYHVDDGRRMVISHTYVPPSARGKDIALRLVERAVSDAEARKLKVTPQCSYVARVFKRRKEWAPLLA